MRCTTFQGLIIHRGLYYFEWSRANTLDWGENVGTYMVMMIHGLWTFSLFVVSWTYHQKRKVDQNHLQMYKLDESNPKVLHAVSVSLSPLTKENPYYWFFVLQKRIHIDLSYIIYIYNNHVNKRALATTKAFFSSVYLCHHLYTRLQKSLTKNNSIFSLVPFLPPKWNYTNIFFSIGIKTERLYKPSMIHIWKSGIHHIYIYIYIYIYMIRSHAWLPVCHK